jgi:hypothetical protein
MSAVIAPIGSDHGRGTTVFGRGYEATGDLGLLAALVNVNCSRNTLLVEPCQLDTCVQSRVCGGRLLLRERS